MRACELAQADVLVQLLKAVKHLSMSATLLEVLQNANALEILVKLLDEHSNGQHGTVSLDAVLILFAHNISRKSLIIYSKLVLISVG
jgi:hypothetical protein